MKDTQSSRLATLDQITVTAKEAAHRLQSPEGRLLAEYALAFLRETWIAESGQPARDPDKLFGDVAKGMRMIQMIIDANDRG